MFASPDDYVAVSVLTEHTSTVTRKAGRCAAKDVYSCFTPPSRVFRIAGAVVWKLTLGSTVCGEMVSLLPFLCQGYCRFFCLAVQTDLKTAVMTMRLFNHFECKIKRYQNNSCQAACPDYRRQKGLS